MLVGTRAQAKHHRRKPESSSETGHGRPVDDQLFGFAAASVVVPDVSEGLIDAHADRVNGPVVTIHGERRREEEEERGGVYRSERSYGSFQRVIPLPEGAITEQAKASFRDGVLEITMPAPPQQVTQGRRLEVTEGTPSTRARR